ncbi:hypothetical protein ACOMHN_053567 [Nucella lapillus]
MFVDAPSIGGKQGASEENLFGFGYGPRGCIGQQLVWNIIDEVLHQLLTRYSWVLQDHQDLTHKYLPVSRPRGSVMVTLKPVSPSSSSSSPSLSAAAAAAAVASAEALSPAVQTCSAESPSGADVGASAAADTI